MSASCNAGWKSGFIVVGVPKMPQRRWLLIVSHTRLLNFGRDRLRQTEIFERRKENALSPQKRGLSISGNEKARHECLRTGPPFRGPGGAGGRAPPGFAQNEKRAVAESVRPLMARAVTTPLAGIEAWVTSARPSTLNRLLAFSESWNPSAGRTCRKALTVV